MRPLPRVLALTDGDACRREDFPVKVAALASAGSPLAIVIRAPDEPAAVRLAWLDRARALVAPTEASLFAHADPALGRLAGTHGVHLRSGDLPPGDARRVHPGAWLGVSVHDQAGARRAFDEGADFVIAGHVFDTPSHRERPARGLDWLAALTAGVAGPVFAIGGITAARVASVRQAGAWGVAAIGALIGSDDPARAAAAFVEEIAA